MIQFLTLVYVVGLLVLLYACNVYCSVIVFVQFYHVLLLHWYCFVVTVSSPFHWFYCLVIMSCDFY